MATKEAIKSCWRLLAVAGTPAPPAWKMHDVNTEAVVAWEAVLHDVTDKDLTRATIAYLRSDNAKYWPLPGQLLRLLPKNQIAALNTADSAWGTVCQNARYKGYYQLSSRPALSENAGENECIWKAIDAVGGIQAICMSSDTDDAAIRAHFCAAYNAYQKRQQICKEERKISVLFSENFYKIEQDEIDF